MKTNPIQDLLDELARHDKRAKDNSNDLYKKYGGFTSEYKVERLKEFKIGRKFTYGGFKYIVTGIDENFITCKRLGWKIKRAWFSRRKESRIIGFSITSNMDLMLRWIE